LKPSQWVNQVQGDVSPKKAGDADPVQVRRHPVQRLENIGCGNDAASLTKRWFPGCTYHGTDIQEYNLSEKDEESIDTFFHCTADYQGYDAIENEAYDFVIANHVVEHTDDPPRLARIAAAKVKAGGLLWIAYPSFRSLSLPPGLDGFTNRFCDDPTHITVVDSIALCNALLASGMKILKAGRSRDAFRSFTGALTLPINLIRLATRG